MRLAIHVTVLWLVMLSIGTSLADMSGLISCVDDDNPAAIATVDASRAASSTNGPASSLRRHVRSSPLHCGKVSPFANAIPGKGPVLQFSIVIAGRFAVPDGEKRTGIAMPPLIGPPRT